MKYKVAAKYLQKSGAFITKWVKHYFEVGNVDDLSEGALDGATTTKKDTVLVKECKKKYEPSMRNT